MFLASRESSNAFAFKIKRMTLNEYAPVLFPLRSDHTSTNPHYVLWHTYQRNGA